MPFAASVRAQLLCVSVTPSPVCGNVHPLACIATRQHKGSIQPNAKAPLTK